MDKKETMTARNTRISFSGIYHPGPVTTFSALREAHIHLGAKGKSPFRELGKISPAPAAPLFAEFYFVGVQFLILKS